MEIIEVIKDVLTRGWSCQMNDFLLLGMGVCAGVVAGMSFVFIKLWKAGHSGCLTCFIDGKHNRHIHSENYPTEM